MYCLSIRIFLSSNLTNAIAPLLVTSSLLVLLPLGRITASTSTLISLPMSWYSEEGDLSKTPDSEDHRILI